MLIKNIIIFSIEAWTKEKFFLDEDDWNRFLQSMDEFNSITPIGSIYENSFNKNDLDIQCPSQGTGRKKDKLVNFVCYCINPNHYHFLLEQVVDNGIEKFMQRLGNGYTKFFNNKYLRSGSLFQGRYKSVHIDSNEYLLHLSIYINLNDKLTNLDIQCPSQVGGEYIGGNNYSFCDKDIVLDQFNKTEDYEVFANDSLKPIMQKKKWKIFYWNDMDIINLGKFLKEKGESSYRLKQIKKAVFCDLINNWDEATALSKNLREELKKNSPSQVWSF